MKHGRRFLAASPETMEKYQGAGKHQRKEHHGQHSVGPSASPHQVGHGAGEVGDSIHVWQVGAYDQRSHAHGAAPPKSAAGQGGPKQRVADRIYSSLASNSS